MKIIIPSSLGSSTFKHCLNPKIIELRSQEALYCIYHSSQRNIQDNPPLWVTQIAHCCGSSFLWRKWQWINTDVVTTFDLHRVGPPFDPWTSLHMKLEIKAQKEENGAVKSSIDSRTTTGSLVRQTHPASGRDSQTKHTTNNMLLSVTEVSRRKGLGADSRSLQMSIKL
jgi:hypothetical protein